MEPRKAPVSLIAKNTAPVLQLRTGYLDDRRSALGPHHECYVVFADAHRLQDGWSDAAHRRFWITHLGLWPHFRGQRASKEAVAFGIAMVMLEGDDADALDSSDERGLDAAARSAVEEMPGRSWESVRDRDIVDIAKRIAREMLEGPSSPRLPRPHGHGDGSTSFPGPTHPGVVAAMRGWRLPRIWADRDEGAEEAALPPPLAGRINLPRYVGDPRAFASIGNASLDVIRQAEAVAHARLCSMDGLG